MERKHIEGAMAYHLERIAKREYPKNPNLVKTPYIKDDNQLQHHRDMVAKLEEQLNG